MYGKKIIITIIKIIIPILRRDSLIEVDLIEQQGKVAAERIDARLENAYFRESLVVERKN